MGHSIVISGAGVAGSTAAYWLARHGFEVTVVERAAGHRSSGNPVDVKGSAVDVVERMGIMPQLREAATQVDRLLFVDAGGRTRSSVATRAFAGSAGEQEVEIARTDLAAILLSAARDHADIRWGDAISGLTQDGDGVIVAFEQSATARFDLVIGADGVHSGVRRLAFGPEARFIRQLGMFVATAPVDRPIGSEREVVMYNTPGRALGVHPGAGNPGAAFMFRAPKTTQFDSHDLAQHKRLVAAAYPGELGVFARYLDQLQAADDIYFDAVTRVVLPQWSTGRVTLVGDAASSLSLFGDGSTLAIAGAYTLTEELAAAPHEIPAALRRYEQRHRRLARPRQLGFFAAGMLLVPKTRVGITMRDLAIRVGARR
jgi:2-polyprenyl-6-methoxyphenol hydroxylase-like FAD-dependent oxidoreductase